MKNYRKESIAAVIAMIFVFSAFAIANPVRQNVWTKANKAQLGSRGAGVKTPSVFEAFRLDKRALESLLNAAPEEFTDAPEMILSLPMPDGTFQRFSIAHSLVVDPGLVAKYPQLGQTYTGQGLDDPSATVRFDLLSSGFHGMVLSTKGTVMIDPYRAGDTDTYISYFKREMPRSSEFKCLVGESSFEALFEPIDLENLNFLHGIPDTEVLSGTQLRTYRVAIAATWEYCDVQPGDNTITNCLAGQVTVLNRVNQVYERDVAIRMVMIPTNGQIVFAANNPTCGPGQNQFCTAANDPYTNADGVALLGQNQTTIDGRIGTGAYDLGHVFSTGGGGIAALESPCVTANKAMGVTGQPSPFGDPFAIDFVAHEFGHQWGGNHTFNAAGQGSCVGNRAAAAAYEPGSGVTIMGYAGICGNQNLAANSIDTFHVKSIEEMVAYSTTGTGNTCAATTATGNTPPSVTSAGDFTIPKLTPFALSASASDPNGDSITYDWQEYDLGPSTLAIPNTDNPNAMPIFRPYEPTTSGRRFFPSPFYSLFFANVPPATVGSALTGELLPQVGGRVMTFQVIARDNRAGGGGVNTASSTLTVASNSGPFEVTAPNTPVSITGGGATTVSWNVNNTTAPPVNEANVRIRLSTDGGNTYTTTLVGSTSNDGSEIVTMPNIPTNTARIKIEAVNSVFFDISDTDFTITAGTPTPTPTPSPINPPADLRTWFTADGDTRYFTGTNPQGVLQGNANFRVGRVGQAFGFDGDGDHITFTDDSDLRPVNLTMETWVKFDSLSSVVSGGAPNGYQVLAFKKNSRAAGSGFEEGYVLNKQSNNTLGIGFNSPTGQTSFAVSTTAVQIGQWYHIAATYDGTNVKIYVNGNLENTGPVVAPIDYGLGSPLYLGSSGLPFNGYFNGTMDEFSLYPRALTASEIGAVYYAGVTGKRKQRQTDPGTNVQTQIADATVTFANVSAGGTTTKSGPFLASFPNLPPGLTYTGIAYDISTTASHVNGSPDDLRVCFNLPSLTSIGAANLRILHLESGNWVNRTASGNTISNFCTDDLPSLSPFVIMEAPAGTPTATPTNTPTATPTATPTNTPTATPTATPAQCVAPPSGLVAWYRAENDVEDAAGTFDGTLEGSATYGAGKVGQAFSLSSSSLGAAVTPEINVLDTYSIEFWVYPDGPQGSFRNLIVTRNPHPDGEFSGLYLRNTTNSYLTFGTINSAASSIPQDQWTHVAVTYSHPFDTKMYLNGTLAGSSNNLINRLRSILVMGSASGTLAALNGKIDEVSFYNRVLSQTEIQDIVNAGSDGKCPTGSPTPTVTPTPTLTATPTVTPTPTPVCYPAPSGMVSWWKGDGTANDSAGSNNGALQNGATYANGISGQAFSFNGSNQYMLVGDPIPASLQIQNEITLESWIYVTSYPSDLGVIVGSQRDSSLNSGATIMLDGRTDPDGQTAPPGHIHFQIGSGGGYHVTNSNSQVPLNQWVHIVATRNANENGKIYYNGVLQPSTSVAWNGTISYNGSWFAIGQQKDLNRPFNGLIDEAAIYNRSLTAAEVAGIYAAGSAGMCPIPTPTPTPAGAPTAAGVLNGTISSGQTLTGVTVTYTDDIAINVSTIDNNDIRVTGPNGFDAPASLQSLDIPTNGTPRVAGYLLGSPGGSWDIGDNGTYSIVMNANQVSDTGSAFVAAGVIGTFVVDLTPPPTPTPTNTPTATPTNTPTATPTNTPTATPTNTPTATPTNTPTATPTNTPTATPTNTPTATPTNTPTATPTPSIPTPYILAGADSGQSEICTFNPNGTPRTCLTPFGPSYTGGIRVATGDINGDGTSDIIAGRATGASHLKVYDGRTNTILWDFFAYGANTFGINVAAGDTDGDGKDDVIVGPGAGGFPVIHIYSGANAGIVRGFAAYPWAFTGGVRVAAGDLDGDGRSDIITGPGPGGSGVVKVFSGFNGTEIDNFTPFAGFTGGLFVGAGHVNTDGIADVIVGADDGLPRAPVRVFDGADLSLIHSILTQVGGTTGVRVGSQDINNDGRDDIVTGSGPGTPGVVKVYNAVDAEQIAGFVVYNQRPGGGSTELGEFQGGVSIAAGSLSNAAPTPTPTTLSIAGTIRQYSVTGAFVPQAGTTVVLTGTFGASTVSDANGRYRFQNLPLGGNYTVFANGLEQAYEPNSHSYTALSSSVLNSDFMAFAGEIPRKARVQTSFATPGSSVTVPVMFNSLGNEKALDFSVAYDLNPLSSPTVTCGTDAPDCSIIMDVSVAGKLGVRILLASSLASGDREIARITFQTVSTSVANSDITFGDVPTARSTRDSEGNILTTNYQNGLVVFSQGFEGDLSPRPSGDGLVLVNDVVAVRRLVVGLDVPSPVFNEFQRADTAPANSRGDGQLDALDVVQIRRYAAQLDTIQTAGGTLLPNVLRQQPLEMFGLSSRRIRVVESNRQEEGKLQIAIELDGVGNESALSFTLRYDPKTLSRPVATSANGNLVAGDASNGRLGVVIDSTEPLNGQIITITFDLAEDNAERPLFFDFDSSLTPLALSDFAGESIPTSAQSRRLTLRSKE